MTTKKLMMALALAAALASTGCANDRTEGGGGGDRTTVDDRAAGGANNAQDTAQGADRGRDKAGADERRGYEDRTTMGEKMRANMSTDLVGNAREFAGAYARAPWVHANLAAGDWERADDDLAYISDQLADLLKDDDLEARIKQRIDDVQPLIAKLDGQIGAKNQGARVTAHQLVNKFAEISNDRNVVAWMGEKERRGGGAGMGEVGPDRDRARDGHDPVVR